MADISKISPDGGTTKYNIKDATARTDVSTINGKIPSSASSSNKLATASDVNAKVSWADAGKSVKKNYDKTNYSKETSLPSVTYTVHSDGSIDVNGTMSANGYLAAGGAATFESDFTDDVIVSVDGISDKATFTLWDNTRNAAAYTDHTKTTTVTNKVSGTEMSAYIEEGHKYRLTIYIASGKSFSNETIKPMIRKATVLDGTWEPRIPDNTELMTWEANAKTGVHNWLPYPYKTATASNRGIDYTSSSDGSILVDGTQNDQSSRAIYQLHGAWNTTTIILPAGRYKLYTGSNNANILLCCAYGTTFLGSTINGIGEIYAPNGISYITCEVEKGADIDNVTIYPMICFAEDVVTDYTPYAMTNRELTDSLAVKTLVPTLEEGFTFTADTKVEVQGNVVNLGLSMSGASISINTSTLIMNIPSGYRPSHLVNDIVYTSDGAVARIFIGTNGDVKILSPSAAISSKDIFGNITYIKA